MIFSENSSLNERIRSRLTFRFLLIFGPLAYFSSGELFRLNVEGYKDPELLLILTCVFPALIWVSSFIFTWIKEHLEQLSYIFFFCLSLHLNLIFYLNDLFFPLSLALMLLLVITSFFIIQRSWLFWYLFLTNFSHILLILVSKAEVNFQERLLYIGTLLLISLLTLIFQWNRLSVQGELTFKNQLLATLFNVSQDALLIWDSQNKQIVDANPTAIQLLTHSSPQDTSDSLGALLNQPHSLEFIESRMKNKDFWIGEVELSSDSKGVQRLANVAIKQITLKNKSFYYFRISDISETLIIKNALKHSEIRFKALIQHSQDLIMILNEDWQIKYVNPSIHAYFKRHPQEVLLKDALDFIPENKRLQAHYFLQKVIHQPSLINELKDFELVNTEGRTLYFDGLISNQLANEAIQGIVVHLHNVTERKLFEKELIKSNFELDAFVYRASHDLRAPLLSILGLVDLLDKVPTEKNRLIPHIKTSIQRLDHFVTDLNLFSRQENQLIYIEEVHIHELVEQCWKKLNYLNQHEWVELKNLVPKDFCVSTDRFRLENSLKCLLSNALKFHDLTKDGPWVEIKASVGQNSWQLEVNDNGSGIKKVVKDQIFQMFFKGSDRSFGSGLGLYVVKNAVEKLGGLVTVESEYGMGSSFKLTFPRQENFNSIEESSKEEKNDF